MAVTRMAPSVASGIVEPPRAILFDYGHTLVDFQRTEEALRDAYEQIRARIEAVAYMEVPELLDLIERVAGGVDNLVAESYRERRLEELDIVAVFREALAGVGFDLPDDVMDHIVALDHSAYSRSITVEPETVDTLRDLRARGYRTGLVSNVTLRPHLMQEDLDRLGIASQMDGMVFSSEIGVRKPDPRIFHEALQRIVARPEETVFVGDRLYDDVSGAQSVGMRAVHTVQFRNEDEPEVQPDARIGHLSELATVLEPWGGYRSPGSGAGGLGRS
jgi:HAD superfamily hydrolase (TIGR01662 family)